jgi:thiamine pyrophosphate-dependent acetolactate synthase large subunit-like protein
MAVGAALALKDSSRLSVAIIGDGDYLMGVNALWTAAHYRIPLLVIVANNRSYHNCEVHQYRVAKLRNRSIENNWIGQRIDDPQIDLAGLACTQGLEAEGPISDFADLSEALQRAVGKVEKGYAYVIDVIISPNFR